MELEGTIHRMKFGCSACFKTSAKYKLVGRGKGIRIIKKCQGVYSPLDDMMRLTY